jgi:uncharacterized membrane protein YfcA
VVAVLAATLVVAAGVQGLIGLGLGLVSAPVVTLAAPGLLLWLAVMMPLVTLVREHHDIDWFGLGWSLPARVVGTAAGVALVASVSPAGLGIAVSVIVLLAVLLSVRPVALPVDVRTLSLAGFVSGISGTATSIGGPPMAILYQHRSRAQIRSTLGLYFVAGSALSLTGLGLAGQLEADAFRLALVLLPTLVVGFALSRLVDRRVDRYALRVGVLVVCAASSLAVLVRSLTIL